LALQLFESVDDFLEFILLFARFVHRKPFDVAVYHFRMATNVKFENFHGIEIFATHSSDAFPLRRMTMNDQGPWSRQLEEMI
jgi:hypothetical protein